MMLTFKRIKNKSLERYNENFVFPYGKNKIDEAKNVILAKDFFKGLDTKKTMRNNNILVFSSLRERKCFIEPNILQANNSFIIIDINRYYVNKYSVYLREKGYDVKIVDFENVSNSNHYNPFLYIKAEIDIFEIVNAFINDDDSLGPAYEFIQPKRNLLLLLMLYIWRYYPKEKQTMFEVYDLLKKGKDELDVLFKNIDKSDYVGDLIYDIYMYLNAAGVDIVENTIIDLAKILSVFTPVKIRTLMENDNLSLDLNGVRKQATFIVLSSCDVQYCGIARMIYMQYISVLNKQWNNLESFILCDIYLDNNIDFTPMFKKFPPSINYYNYEYIVTIDSYIILKHMFEKNVENVISNFDTILYVGKHDFSTMHCFLNIIKDFTQITINALYKLGVDECMCYIRNQIFFHGKIYDVSKHPNLHLE